jgi:hypothetical protein
MASLGRKPRLRPGKNFPESVELTIVAPDVAIVISVPVVMTIVVPYPQHAIDRAERAADCTADDASDGPADRTGGTTALVGALMCAAHDALSLRRERHDKKKQCARRGGKTCSHGWISV